MKSFKLISICAAAGLLLTGCGSFTDNTTDTSELEYDSFETVMGEFDELPSLELDNLALSEDITVNRPQRLVGMTLAYRLPDGEAAKKLAGAFFPDKCFEIKEAAALSDYLVREDTGKGGMLSLEGYGFFGYAASGRDFKPQYDPEGKVFLNSRRTALSLKLNDGELSLDKALSLAQQTADKYTEALGMAPLVPTIAKYNSSGFMIRFSPDLAGWLLPDQPVATDGSVNPEMIKSALHQEYRSCVASAEQAGMFAGSGCIFCKEEKAFDKMVTLSSALRFLDVSIASGMDCTIRQISLVQILTSRGTEVQDASELSDSELRAELEGGYETSPAWQFNLTNDSKEYIAYIDCLTGEFAFGQLMAGA